MQEQGLFFKNSAGEQLFAFQHMTENNANYCVVFCHPFGEEKTRSYRSLVNFSRYLANKGISNLRFDMKGAGDSDGDIFDLTIESQVSDTKDAITYLLDKTGCTKVVLIGLRLGATVAALVAEQDPRVNDLVLLSPIIKGNAYWRDMLRMKQFASIWLNQPAVKSSELMKLLDKNGEIEIEGQMLSVDFVNQLKAINLLTASLDFSGRVLITALGKDSLACQFAVELVNNYSKSIKCVAWTEEERDYWSVLSLFDQYHPIETFEFTFQWLEQ